MLCYVLQLLTFLSACSLLFCRHFEEKSMLEWIPQVILMKPFIQKKQHRINPKDIQKSTNNDVFSSVVI